jgi:hypothetical protein
MPFILRINKVNRRFFEQFSIKNTLPPLGSHLDLEKRLYFSRRDFDKGALNS